jgi:hypothetical protein
VYMAAVKEIHYFDLNFDRGPEWYATQFAAAGDEVAVGEATPNYIHDARAMERMAGALPGLRLVISLRDPAERAYSHYWHRRSRGGEDLSFAGAISAEPQRLTDGGPRDRAHFSYVDRGRYLGQVRTVLRLFPRDHVHFMLFEDMRDRPVDLFRGLTDFLAVSTTVVPDLVGTEANRYQEFRSIRLRDVGRRLPSPLAAAVGRLNRVPAEYPPMDADVRRTLTSAYSGERDELAEITGLDLNGWAS